MIFRVGYVGTEESLIGRVLYTPHQLEYFISSSYAHVYRSASRAGSDYAIPDWILRTDNFVWIDDDHC